MKLSKNKTVTRADLTDAVHFEIGLSKTESSKLVDSVFAKIEQSLIANGKVKLSGFGSFTTHLKPERMGRNLSTGASVVITQRKIVVFKPAPKFSHRVTIARCSRTLKGG